MHHLVVVMATTLVLCLTDSSTAQLLNVIDEMGSQYEATLENLRLINSSVASMMSVVLNMHSVMSSQLEWLISQLGGAQDGLRVLTTITTHTAYLVVAILCVLFVKAPGFTRLSLLGIVVTNALIEIKYKISLTFFALTALQITVMLGKLLPLQCIHHSHLHVYMYTGNYFYVWYKHSHQRGARPPPSYLSQPLTAPPVTCSVDTDSEQEEDDHPETISHTPVKQEAIKASPRVRSSFLTVKCEARTRSGFQCKLPALDGTVLCRRHTKYC